MRISDFLAKFLIVVLVVALLFGTLIPGAWREGAIVKLGVPGVFSSIAHYALFMCMALVARISHLRWSAKRVILAGVVLACFTEGMQFLAVDRHPRLIDIGIDIFGLLSGVLISFFFFSLTQDVKTSS